MGTSRVTFMGSKNTPCCCLPVSSTSTCVLRSLKIFSDFKDTFLFPAAFKFWTQDPPGYREVQYVFQSPAPRIQINYSRGRCTKEPEVIIALFRIPAFSCQDWKEQEQTATDTKGDLSPGEETHSSEKEKSSTEAVMGTSWHQRHRARVGCPGCHLGECPGLAEGSGPQPTLGIPSPPRASVSPWGNLE